MIQASRPAFLLTPLHADLTKSMTIAIINVLKPQHVHRRNTYSPEHVKLTHAIAPKTIALTPPRMNASQIKHTKETEIYMRHTRQSIKNASGFTLIEMAISMIVIGVLIGSVIYPYSVWLKKQRYAETVDHVERMSFSIGAFRSANGRYPCPAPMDLPRTDPNYGRATDCTSTTITPGTCSNGICIANSRRTLNTPAAVTAGDFVDINSNNVQDSWELNHTPRVRIGVIPFRDLNIPEDFTLDAYGNRILYAVTEVQAANYTYNVDAGGISIEYRDQANNLQSRINTPHSAHFVVLSHGSNRMGAYTKYGSASNVTCSLSAPDGENCDHTLSGQVDPTFYIDDYTTAAGNTSHDDIALHQMPLNAPLWARSPQNPSAIYAILSSSANGNVGSDYMYNFFTNINPNFFGANTRLWIRGNMLVDQVGGIGGDTLANQFCNNDGTGCFPADLIGGAGDICTSGAMFGIDNAAVACTTSVINIDCPNGQILQYINDGLLVCNFRPCAASTVSSCSQSHSLPASGHGTSLSFYSGSFECNQSTYTCNNGTWDSYSTGQCSCTVGTSTYSLNCPYPCTGYNTYETTQTCAFRSCSQTSILLSTSCSCPPPPPPSCDPATQCCTGTEPSCPTGCDPTIQCCNGTGVGCPTPPSPPSTPSCDPLVACCNGYTNFPTCGPTPSCDSAIQCCNGYSNFPICGIPGGSGPGNPPCYGGVNPPPCTGP